MSIEIVERKDVFVNKRIRECFAGCENDCEHKIISDEGLTLIWCESCQLVCGEEIERKCRHNHYIKWSAVFINGVKHYRWECAFVYCKGYEIRRAEV